MKLECGSTCNMAYSTHIKGRKKLLVHAETYCDYFERYKRKENASHYPLEEDIAYKKSRIVDSVTVPYRDLAPGNLGSTLVACWFSRKWAGCSILLLSLSLLFQPHRLIGEKHVTWLERVFYRRISKLPSSSDVSIPVFSSFVTWAWRGPWSMSLRSFCTCESSPWTSPSTYVC